LTPYLSRTALDELVSRLPALRSRYQEALGRGDPASAALDLTAAYRQLGLSDRAQGWLKVAEAQGGPESGPAAFRLAAETAALALAFDDAPVLARAVERLKGWGGLGLEEERLVLALQVRLSLLSSPAEAFAPLERAFRHLRHHPSPVWASRFLRWRATWFDHQNRLDEAYVAAKKALAQAQGSGDAGEELACWLLLAHRESTPRPKALRAAQTAVELARDGGFTSAEAEAHRALSRLTAGPREAEPLKAFRTAVDQEKEWEARQRAWDRQARAEDAALLGASGEGRRVTDAQGIAVIAGILSRGQDLARSLDEVYPWLGKLMTADIFGVALWEPGQAALDYSYFIEEGRRTRVGLIPVGSHRSLGAWCFRHRKPVRVNDIDREYRTYLKELSRLAEHRPKAMLFQPLVSDRGLLGIVTVQSFAREAYDTAAEAHLGVVAAVLALRLQSEGRPGF
jgi:tetratricopeptide (TPR) repeat protein